VFDVELHSTLYLSVLLLSSELPPKGSVFEMVEEKGATSQHRFARKIIIKMGVYCLCVCLSVVSVLSDAKMMDIKNARSSAGSFSSILNVC